MVVMTGLPTGVMTSMTVGARGDPHGPTAVTPVVARRHTTGMTMGMTTGARSHARGRAHERADGRDHGRPW